MHRTESLPDLFQKQTKMKKDRKISYIVCDSVATSPSQNEKRQRKPSYVICDKKGTGSLWKDKKRKTSYVVYDNNNGVNEDHCTLCGHEHEDGLCKTEDVYPHPNGEEKDNLVLLNIPYNDDCIYEFPKDNHEVKDIVAFVVGKDRRRNAICEEISGNIHELLMGYMTNKFISESILLT